MEKPIVFNYADHLSALAELDHLRSELWTCRNELCLRCGSYKEAHRGACDDCRWRDEQMRKVACR